MGEDMEPWVSTAELAVWTRKTLDELLDDPLAPVVLHAATVVVAAATGLTGTAVYTPETVPARLKVLTAQVAKRAYLNPDQIVREGSLGPIGGDAYAEGFTAGLELTDAERDEIDRVMAGSGGSTGKGLKIMGFGVAHNGYASDGVYLPDTSGSDWMIPVE